MPPDSNVTGSEMALSTTTPLTAKVVARLKQLVDGNAAAAGDVVVAAATQVDRTVYPKLHIEFAWKTESGREPGNRHPSNSNAQSNRAQLDAVVRADIHTITVDPETASELASRLRGNPAENYRVLQNEFKVCDVGSYHFLERCIKCSGQGQHSCEVSACSYGKVPCTQCHDGRHRCYSCGGSGSTSVQTRDYNGNTHYQNTTCRECSGNGRSGSCPSCYGNRTVTCSTCNGTNRVNCVPCRTKGSFLNQTTAWITGRIKRTASLEADAPRGFEQSMSAINLAVVPGQMADTTATRVSPEPAGCSIMLTCSMPHVHVEARCKQVGITLDALGRDGLVPLMPTFLDTLLAAPLRDMLHSTAAPDAVIKAAESSRLTKDLLTQTYTGKKLDADAMSATYDRAISSSVLTEGNKAIVRAFNALGASAVRWFWLLGGPVLVVYAAVLALYDVAAWLPWSFQPPGYFNLNAIYTWDAALLALPLLAFWLACGLLARRTVRKATRSTAARRPSQAWWPVGFAVAMLAANVGPVDKGVTASTLGLPHGAAWQRNAMLWPSRPTMPQSYVRPSPAPNVPAGHLNHR